ncbi:MAG: N-acetylneuraminate synthase family protein [Deltaproteobacteria bacterium]|nr:N-acetylneuraminate synthase family protein [Deltaproteobacteria bacterium]
MPIHFNKKFSISNRVIGRDEPVFIIAEAGVAHFGRIEKAFKLVDLAVGAGADAVKFQIYKTEHLISKSGKEWFDRMKTKELPFEAFKEIQSYCREREIIFLATAHDENSLEYLSELRVPAYKIGSGEVTNWGFIKSIASKGKPIILSTGMYTLDQIHEALSVISETGNGDVAVLHCVTMYPTPPGSVNLTAMNTIKDAFDVLVGYSDHTQGHHFPIAAASLGAGIIEKHISLDFNVPNAQDWKVSCGPEDLHLMIQQIREIEAGLGSGLKDPGKDERLSLTWARKSLTATRDISMGDVITGGMLSAKRPGGGIPPSEIKKVIGKRAARLIKKDEMIQREHFE